VSVQPEMSVQLPGGGVGAGVGGGVGGAGVGGGVGGAGPVSPPSQKQQAWFAVKPPVPGLLFPSVEHLFPKE